MRLQEKSQFTSKNAIVIFYFEYYHDTSKLLNKGPKIFRGGEEGIDMKGWEEERGFGSLSTDFLNQTLSLLTLQLLSLQFTHSLVHTLCMEL